MLLVYKKKHCIYWTYVAQDLQYVLNPNKQTVLIRSLKTFGFEKQKAVLRFWCKQLGFLMPAERKLQHVIDDVIYAMPYMHWQGVEVRRYRDDLYIMSPLKPHDASQILVWDLQHFLEILSINLILHMMKLFINSLACYAASLICGTKVPLPF